MSRWKLTHGFCRSLPTTKTMLSSAMLLNDTLVIVRLRLPEQRILFPPTVMTITSYSILERRADGIVLDALIADQPDHPLIPKLVRGLLGHRTRGRWSNTQENVFILLALNRYFNTYEKVTPDFISRVWLGDDFAGQQEFRGREIDRQQVNVPMRYLAEKIPQTPRNLLIIKDGPGRLYYRVAMNYAPKDLNAAAADYGFAVERVYESVDRADGCCARGRWNLADQKRRESSCATQDGRAITTKPCSTYGSITGRF